MSDHRPNTADRARKVFTALEGADEFSVFSVDPEAHKPLVKLEDDGAATGRPDDARASSSVVRFFRKIFSR